MILRETDLFKGIRSEVMEEIERISIEEEHAKDTVLFEQDEKAERLYILQNGVVDLLIKNGGSLAYILSEPGEVFGWSSLVASGHYTASGICVTDARVVRIEREKLEMIMNQHPDDGLKILRQLGSIFSRRLSIVYKEILAARKQDRTPTYG